MLSQELTDKLSEIVLSDRKRTYNMSKLASTDMLLTVQGPNGTTKKDVTYTPENTMSKDITDLLGNTISIHYVGHLDYKCDPSSNDYIDAFLVSKKLDDEMIMNPRILFSNIDMNKLNDPDYESAVANTLLSSNNIELSQADGYIGELNIIENSSLLGGEEKFDPGFYTYKISGSTYSLVFEDAKIEAAKACKEQGLLQAQKIDKEQEGEDR